MKDIKITFALQQKEKNVEKNVGENKSQFSLR